MFPADNNLDFKFTMESEKALISDDAPFHILLLGNWSGHTKLTEDENNDFSSRLFEIDRDNFEEVLEAINTKLDINIDGNAQDVLSLTFTEIDDFHPDHLFKNISIFSELHELRQRLSKSDTFEKAAEEVRLWFEIEEPKNLSKNQKQEPEQIYSTAADLLDNILSQSENDISPVALQPTENTELSSLIGKVVKPFLVRTDEQEQSKLIAAVDEATSDLMRKILHHPQFKELESAWRGLYFLVRSVETNSKLKIFLLDISKTELSSKFKFADEKSSDDFYKVFENDKDWALICGNYDFQINVDDVALLIRFATIASFINAPFISYINLEAVQNQLFSGASGFRGLGVSDNFIQNKLWNALRNMPESGFIGLLFQRLLIRLPYGADTVPTDTFSFEEFPGLVNHNDYLWTNPYIAIALLLAQSFSGNSWKMKRNLFHDIEGLPLHTFKQSGKMEQLPVAEFLLTQNLCDHLLDEGLMPIISFRDRETVRLAKFQSIAVADKTLKGKWS